MSTSPEFQRTDDEIVSLLSQWLMENDIQPTVGHRFNFRAKPMGDWDGIVYCEVLEVDEPNRLVYGWKGGSDIY